jgi:hypothetical protein
VKKITLWERSTLKDELLGRPGFKLRDNVELDF